MIICCQGHVYTYLYVLGKKRETSLIFLGKYKQDLLLFSFLFAFFYWKFGYQGILDLEEGKSKLGITKQETGCSVPLKNVHFSNILQYVVGCFHSVLLLTREKEYGPNQIQNKSRMNLARITLYCR